MLDLTSGGALSQVLGVEHPLLCAARARADGDAPARLAAALESATGLIVAGFYDGAAAARSAALALAQAGNRDRDRAGVVACRGSALDPRAAEIRWVAHGDGLQAEAAIDRARPAALLVEVVQTRAGVRVAPPGWLARLRDTCTAAGVALIVDESDTGFGRTGTLFAFQKERVEPDFVVVSLALGAGDGALLLARPALAPGSRPDWAPHAAVAAAALAALELIDREGLVENARVLGQLLKKETIAILERRRRWCKDSAGRGLVRGLSLWEDPSPVLARLHERGLGLMRAGELGLLLAPPIDCRAEQLVAALAVLDEALAD